MEQLAGGWKIAQMNACVLPEKLATGFSTVINTLSEARYVPVLYCGEQKVNGTNYMLICKQTLITKKPVEHLIVMVLHQDMTVDDIGGNFSILKIEKIV